MTNLLKKIKEAKEGYNKIAEVYNAMCERFSYGEYTAVWQALVYHVRKNFRDACNDIYELQADFLGISLTEFYHAEAEEELPTESYTVYALDDTDEDIYLTKEYYDYLIENEIIIENEDGFLILSERN
jgi:hypothetical protein